MKNQILAFCIIFFMASCHIQQHYKNKKPLIVSSSTSGLIDCFPPSWDSLKNNWTFCELSAAISYQNTLLVASDKNVPKHSSVLELELADAKIKNPKSPKYLDQDILISAKKFEDFSISPNQQHIFLITAFDRLKKNDWDSYNYLLTWPVGQIDKIEMLDAHERNGVQSSISLRPKIRKALADNNNPEGPEYFKIEGLTATDNQLIFGIREMGKRYDNFSYKIVLLSIDYTVVEGKIKLGDQLKKIYEFNPSPADYPELELPVALSSIEYDPYRKKFYITTSYEHDDKIGAYLWEINLMNLAKGKAPKLLKDSKGKIFTTPHKAEAVSLLNKNTLILIHDDDRNLIENRAAHQAAYQILTLKK